MSSKAGSCIDPKALKGQTVKLPSNVTRIGQDGLALCTPTYVQTMSADIVYIIDNSTSMSSGSFWVNPTNNDTTWFMDNCSRPADTSAGRWVHLRLRHYGGTSGADSLGIDSLYEFYGATRAASGTNGCQESNEPYTMRFQSVRVALDYQAAFDPASNAGVIYFNGAVRQRFPMRPLGPIQLKGLLDSVGLYPEATSTLWAPPFDTARRWLSQVSSGRNKVIILVSDGEPTDDDRYPRLLDTTGATPIYGIYLGGANEATPELDRVTRDTKGRKFVVPPDRPDSLEGVIKSIVASVTRKDAPTATTITNVSNGQTSKAVTITSDTLDTWALHLDSIVALAPGANYIMSISNWKSTAGVQVDTSIFVLDVSGPASPLGETPLTGVPLSTRCFEGTTLQFVDNSWKTIASVSEGGGPVGVKLTPSGQASFPMTLTITSGAGDLESSSQKQKDSVASGAWGTRMPLTVARLTTAVPANQTLEVRNGYDTLRSVWCHPRDGRDCAAAMLPVIAIRQAYVKWVPGSLPGSRGAFVLEAVLPGQSGTKVSADISRHGVKIATASLVRVQDSLFRDTIPFVQGPRRPGGDTLWLNAPSAVLPDSLVATLIWGLDKSVLSDTALIIRPTLSLSLKGDGVSDVISIAMTGAQPDAQGKWPVHLWASTRTQTVSLDSSLKGSADVTLLAATGKGQTWIKGRFVDPVYGDTAIDSVLVPAPSSYVKFTPGILDGPVGTFAITAEVPGALGSTLDVVIWRRGSGLGTVKLVRQADSTFAGSVSFRQGPVRPSGDTLWMNQPPHGVPDTLVATAKDPSGETLADMALVTRPVMRLVATSDGGTVVSLDLLGGFPDARGARTGSIMVTTTNPVSFDATGKAQVQLLSQLSKVSGSSVVVWAWYVDPIYGDTASASVSIAVPARSIRFVEKVVDGPRGSLGIELIDPWTATDTRDVVIVHGGDSVLVRLTRTSTGAFVGTPAFIQKETAFGDTLTLGRPKAGNDSVTVVLPVLDALPQLTDRAMIRRPPLSLVLVAQADHPQYIDIALKGGNADAQGMAIVNMSGPVAIPTTSLVSTGGLSWSGLRQLDTILPESPDSVDIYGTFVDPLYGDTAWAFLKVKSPWFPATITVAPEKADPRKKDTVLIRVLDKDAHPAKVDTVLVTVGKVTLKLVETGINSGEYVLRVNADAVDPDWTKHMARNDWKVDLVYTDPDHPRDVATTSLVLEFQVPPPEAKPVETVQPALTHWILDQPHLEVIRPNPDWGYPPGSQGAELKIWEHTRTLAYVYDKIGTFVASWEGELDTDNPEVAARYLVKWDGCDKDGRPTAPGIYLLRIVMIADDGTTLGNLVFTLGRKAPRDYE